MIQLYKKGNTDYEKNGDHVLNPISCFLDRKLNGSWELSIEVPLDKQGAYKDLTVESVIKAPTPNGDKLFYVYDTDKIAEDSVEASARPVFLCAADDAFLLDVRPTIKNGQEALDILTAGTAYTGESNITTVNTAYYVRKNLIEAIASDDENSFLNRWGGEILYDDFNIIINDRVGGDYGVKIMYGRNLESVEEHSNIEEVVTRIIPMAYNGYTLEGNMPWIDSSFIDAYERPHTKVIKFEDVKLTEDCHDDEVGFDSLEDLRAELRKRCKEEYEKGIDKPSVTLSVNMIDLSKTVVYKEYNTLETVDLGDTVRCVHAKLGIETTARVIGQKWNCILKRNENLTIGNFEFNYFDKLTSTAKAVDKVIDRRTQTVMADRVAGILNGIQTQLRLQSTVAQKVEGRAFTIEDLDPDSPLYGCMIFGTQGLQISVTRTEDGRDWDWTTAITAKGIVADAIITGILTDKTGNNYWDLDTGEFSLSSGSKIVVDEKEIALSEYIRQQSETAKALQIVTTRDFVGIPTNAEGDNGIYTNAKFEVSVYYGFDDVSSLVAYSVNESGVVGKWDIETKSYTVSNLLADEGYVEVTVTYSGVLTIKKRVQVAKIKAGSAGAYRYMLLSVQTVKRTADGNIIPSHISASAYSQTEETVAAFSGTFVCEESENGSTYLEIYRSMSNEATIDYELNNVIVTDTGDYIVTDDAYRVAAGGLNNVQSVRISLYDGEELIDRQSVTVINEAQDLTSEDVFNLLTDNGRIKGIYRMNDQLYISFSYAQGGVLNLGGAGNERGILQLLDTNGDVIGTLDETGARLKLIEVSDRIVICDSAGRNVSLGFDQDTGIFYINGDALQINIPTLVSNMITAVSAKIDTLTVNQQIIANTIKSDTYIGNSMSLTGDVEAGDISLMMHEHDGIQSASGNRRFGLDYISGNDYALRSYKGDDLVSGAFWIGTNASRVRQVYSTAAENVSSDERKKDIIGEFDERHHELFKRMKPIFYRWKEGNDKRIHAGFGARATERAMQESGAEVFAVEMIDGEYSIAYTELIPLLFAEIARVEDKLKEMEEATYGK